MTVGVLTTAHHTTLYVGVTNNVAQRLAGHDVPGVTSTDNLTKRVYVETYDRPRDATERETRPKRWRRAWKVALIEAQSPEWRDPSEDVW